MANRILQLANDISLDRNSNIRSSISNSGFYRVQKSGPIFYTISANLPLLTKAKYIEVENELLIFERNLLNINADKFFTASIPSNVGLFTNAVLVKNGVNDIAVKENATGSSFTLTNVFSVSNLNGEYIQFNNQTKVYQIVSHSLNTVSGELIINLNQSLINSISQSTTFNLGSGGIIEDNNGDNDDIINPVNFKLALQSGRPNVTVVPGPGYNYYHYDTFTFREVL